MALQLSVAARNARADAIESATGTSAKLQIRTLAPPADCATADTGALLIEIALPSDWMNAASSGSKTKLGVWSGSATGTGTAGHFRVKDSAGTNTHIQGVIGSDMTLDNASIASGQTVTVSTFTINEANA